MFSSKPSFGHRAVQAAFAAIAPLGLLAWMQNMYPAPIHFGWTIFAMAFSVALIIPIGLILLNWIATLWGGALRVRAPLLFALGAISTITFGLTLELALSVVAVGWELDGTTAAQGATIYVLVGGSVFGCFAALYYWFPKMTGRVMAEGPARLSFLLLLVGVHLTVIPMFLAGLQGQPTDIYKFYGDAGVTTDNLVASIGSFVLTLGVLVSLANVVSSVHRGVRVGHDPWGGHTLEWFALSPAPEHNFDVLPDVRSPEPMRDIREAIRRNTEGWRAPEPTAIPEPAPQSAPAPAEPAAPDPGPAPTGPGGSGPEDGGQGPGDPPSVA